jgi:hypothetical protein
MKHRKHLFLKLQLLHSFIDQLQRQIAIFYHLQERLSSVHILKIVEMLSEIPRYHLFSYFFDRTKNALLWAFHKILANL